MISSKMICLTILSNELESSTCREWGQESSLLDVSKWLWSVRVVTGFPLWSSHSHESSPHFLPVDLDSLTTFPPVSSEVVLTFFPWPPSPVFVFSSHFQFPRVFVWDLKTLWGPRSESNPSCICQIPNLTNYHPQTLLYHQLVDNTMVLSTVCWLVKILIIVNNPYLITSW
jgi:hypothetical protein